MKKILLALAAVSLIASCAEAQSYGEWRWRTVQVPWNFVRASTYSGAYVVHNDDNGAIVDSAGVGVVFGQLAATNYQVLDTTAWFPLDDMIWSYAGVAPTTAFSPIRLTMSCSNTSEDTLGIVTDAKFDNAVAAFAVTTPANLLTTAGGTFDNLLTGSLATDADAAIAVTQVPYGTRMVRFRITATNGVASGCKLFISYPVRR